MIDLNIHNIESVEIENTIFDGFVVKKLIIKDNLGNKSEINLFSDSKKKIKVKNPVFKKAGK